MDRDIILRKLESLARCVVRIEQKRPDTLVLLMESIDLQDILSINLERAIQVSVDIGAHLIADLPVAPPKSMGDVFSILAANGVISEAVSTQLRKAVGFRNLSVHAYDQVDWERVFDILHERLHVFREYTQSIASRIREERVNGSNAIN